MRLHALLGILVVAVHAASSAQGPPRGDAPPPQVMVTRVQPETVPVTFDYVGVSEPSKTVEVRARIQGFLDSRDFEEGAFVKDGERLFLIDPRSFEANNEIALARVEQAQARLKLAEQELARLQGVSVPGAIAEADLDKAVADRLEAAASLRLAKAEQANAELELSYTIVRAPLTGFVDKALKDTGSLVDAGANSLLTVVRQLDPLYVTFSMPEEEYFHWQNAVAAGALKLAEGVEAPCLELTLLDGSRYGHRGTIDFESSAIEVATGAVGMRATFPNPKHLLKAGQFVKVRIAGYVQPGALAVPQRAVSQSPQGSYVYVVGEDNKAE